MADLLPLLAAERRAIADLLEELSSDELARPSLCEGWSVRDVFAHLTLSIDPSLPSALASVVRSGFRPPRAIQLMTAEAARRPDAELVSLLRDRAERRWSPPGFGLEAPLTDALVHGVDIRLPLGRSHEPDPEAVRAGLAFAAGRSAGRGGFFTRRSQHRGLRFEAPDVGWTSGRGPVLGGPGALVLAALCGRPAALDRLEGDGVGVLRQRLV